MHTHNGCQVQLIANFMDMVKLMDLSCMSIKLNNAVVLAKVYKHQCEGKKIKENNMSTVNRKYVRFME